MTGGQLLVEGDVGDYAAQQLQGGEILIRGLTRFSRTGAGFREDFDNKERDIKRDTDSISQKRTPDQRFKNFLASFLRKRESSENGQESLPQMSADGWILAFARMTAWERDCLSQARWPHKDGSCLRRNDGSVFTLSLSP
jgi:hypothetical protein